MDMKRSSFGNEHRRYTLTRRWSDNDELGWMQIIMLNEEEIEAIKAAFWDDDDAWEPRSPRYGEDR